MDNLALKYRPKSFEDVVEQDAVVSILSSMCEQEGLPNRNFLLVGPRGCGKAQPLFSNVLTTSGFKPMGKIQIGDEVFTGSGNIAYVSGVFPQGKLQIYSIELQDGSNILVAENHLNEISIKSLGKYYDVTKNTKDLIHEFLYKTSPLYINCTEVDWPDKINCQDLSDFESYNLLSSEDFSYFQICKEDRIALLSKLKSYMFENCISVNKNNKTFIQNLKFIVESLGGYVIATNVKDKVFLQVIVNIEVGNKADIEYNPESVIRRQIVNIVKISEAYPCQCIMIDHPDHTYISDNFIQTHNTTLGRIVASNLNENQGTPIEIDAASHNGVESIRDIVNQAKLYPIGSKYKIFIIDECHALSNAAWQSMLKVLEEQPAKSIFILLTTNPEKIPATILSRVQKFQLSNISLEGIENRLKYVISEENKNGRNITYDDDAISYIAKLAKGGMRDALTLLDKALVDSNNITQVSLKTSLDIPDYSDYFDLLNAYAKKDDKSIIEIVSKVYNSGKNFVKWFEEFQSFVMNVAKYVFIQDINKTMIPNYYEDKISKYNEKHAKICLNLSQILVDLISRISRTEYMEEVALSYLCK